MTVAERQARYRQRHSQQRRRLDLFVDTDTWQAIEALAEREGLSRSQAVAVLVRRAVGSSS